MRLNDRHKTAIKLLLEGDLTIEEIAQRVKVSRKTLYNWQNDADFEQEYEAQLKEIDRRTRRKICTMVDAALNRQRKILTDSKNDNAAATVAKDILDRAGYAPDDNINITKNEPVVIVNNIPRTDEE